MNQNSRKTIAEKTREIIEKGVYTFEENKINVADFIKNSHDKTYIISANDEILIETSNTNNSTIINVVNETTIQAIQSCSSDEKVLVLNFASAKNPGGGFLGGASAQEESLARSSSLYHSLLKCMEVYKYNRERDTYLYSDYMIYSPEVVFWMDDNGYSLPKPIIADVITSPAPNRGAMIQNNRLEQMDTIEHVFIRRIRKICRLAVKHKVDVLILGAWGCGVFRNDPVQVAEYFHRVIRREYGQSFKKIIFAVLDSSQERKTISAFENIWNKK